MTAGLILNILIRNSIEAIGTRQGKIAFAIRTIPASKIPKPHIALTDWKPEAEFYACVEVSDTGSGISAKDMSKLFDRFFTTRFTGRGLGLPVILGIVRAWSGAISVESKEGQGSIFYILSPQ